MQTSETRFPPPDAQLGLAFAKEILSRNPLPELNLIDGAFYWQVCRTDFIVRVASLRQMIESESGTHESFELIVGPLRDTGVPWEWVLWHAIDRLALPMRPPSFRWDQARPTGPAIVAIGTVEWSGRHVAEFIENSVPMHLEILAKISLWDPQRDGNSDTIDLGIKFKRRNDGWVEILLPVPLPSPSAIATEYDEYIKKNHSWLESMPDGAALINGQRPDVAVRTWAIGLLVGSGMSVDRAINEACDALSIPTVTHARFNQDRSRLIARVPEAKPYIYQRPERRTK